MASEWLQKAQTLRAKRGEETEKEASPSSNSTDFRGLLRKPGNTPSASPGASTTPPPKTPVATTNSVPAWKQRLGFGKSSSTSQLTQNQDKNQDKNIPAWKQRLEAQKSQQATPATGNGQAQLPTEAKALRAKCIEEADMRKKAENKIILALAKIAESKKLYKQALEILDSTEMLLEQELKEQQAYDSVSSLPPEEQEKAKEEEWKKWMDDIDKRKKIQEDEQAKEELDKKEKEKKEKKDKKEKKEKKEKKSKVEKPKVQKVEEPKKADPSPPAKETTPKPSSANLISQFENKSKQDNTSKTAPKAPQNNKPPTPVATVKQNKEEEQKENQSEVITTKIETPKEVVSEKVEESVQKEEPTPAPVKASNIRGMFEAKAKEEANLKVISKPKVEVIESDEESEEEDEEEDDVEEESSSSEEKQEEETKDETVIEF